MILANLRQVFRNLPDSVSENYPRRTAISFDSRRGVRSLVARLLDR